MEIVNDSSYAESLSFGDLETGDSFVFDAMVMLKMDGGYTGNQKVNAVVLETGETWIMDDADLVDEVNQHRVIKA